MPDIEIRPIETTDEMHAVEDLQRQVWPGAELDVVPLHVLTTVAHNGGVLVGAWDGDKLVGFVFGFIGTDEANADRPAMARLKHCSHMLGVLPEYRDQDIGFRLKLAQRDAVHRQGIRLITWTFDPLESRNARLNIARLGTIARTYLREVYGQMADGLNVGLPSDRFLTEWWLTSQRVTQRLRGVRRPLSLQSFTQADTPILNPTRWNAAGLPEITGDYLEPSGVFALVEIPSNFQQLKAADMSLAREWKAQTRNIFERAFASGYIATDFLYETVGGRQRSFYVLSQGEAQLGGEADVSPMSR